MVIFGLERLAELLFFVWWPWLRVFGLEEGVALNLREDRGGLLTAHDRDARVGPHKHEPPSVCPPAHCVVTSSERTSHNHSHLGDLFHNCGKHAEISHQKKNYPSKERKNN